MKKFFEFTDRFIDKHIHNAKINSALKKVINLEMFYYILFGVLATVVSLTNKFIVFRSKSTESQTLFKEIISFAAARLFSLGVEEAGLAIAQFIFHSDEAIYFTVNLTAEKSYEFTGTDIAKIVLQVIVVIMNYVFSKLFIFNDNVKLKKDKNKDKDKKN